MNIVKINRENLIKGNYSEIERRTETTETKCNMESELGDFLFKLFQINQNIQGKNDMKSTQYIMNFSFKMEICLNFVVRKSSLDEIREQVVSLYRDNIGRIKSFYDITAMNLVVLDEGEEYIPTDTNEYENLTNLSYLEGVA